MSGLQSFMERNPAIYYKVNIPSEIEKCRKATKKTPLILIDGSCSRRIFGETDPKRILTGGQFKLYKQKADKFINFLQSFDVELVAFFDGCRIDDMRDKWIAQRNEDINSAYEILDTIENEGLENVKENMIRRMYNIGMVIKSCFQSKCKVIQSTLVECDSEIITYAKENKALAVFSQDADFAVAQADFAYWSYKDLNYEDQSTYVYDGRKLAQGLGLQVEQLPLLRTMIGNDYVLNNTLHMWFKQLNVHQHRNSNFNKHDVISKVALYLKNFDNSVESYKRLATRALGSQDKFHVIKMSVDSYMGIKREKVTSLSNDIRWNDLLMQVVNLVQDPHSNLSPMVFDILYKQVFMTNMLYEDFRKYDIPPSGILWRPVRAKIYGILLLDFCSTNGKKIVKEWVCHGGDISIPHFVEAVEPSCSLSNYKLQDFWAEDKDEDLINIAWKLFCNAMHEDLPVEAVRSINEKIMATTLLVLFMHDECEMTQDEIDAFLMMSALCSTKDDVTEYSEAWREQFNTRLLRLSAVFLKGLSTIWLFFNSTCFLIPKESISDWNIFDGALLQCLYKSPLSENSVDDETKQLFQSARNFIDKYSYMF
ncbi:constitutive coactivator of peroxisome proliferator-activated receptor gamma-like [Ctenocephalides felis]|uniref:constitutive coactivator of peroxisome proliferator-activated receptor gamma-like n=1 Tax=Ctenocephalides felis TaxID=7515 RepID=UPI000E6E31A7|nr:constitutive coactivator of peroxisome proliferator-activated receptor gamma-like [Ctenocephalides felis]